MIIGVDNLIDYSTQPEKARSGITKVIIGDENLTTVPSVIRLFPRLQQLYLSGNHIQSLPQLSRLAVINLDNNNLTKLTPDIGMLTSLRELYLGFNQLTTLPVEMSNLTNLRILDLQSNSFSVIPSVIFPLSQLQSLNLMNNELTSDLSIDGLSGLSILNVFNNHLTTYPVSFRHLSSLQRLYINRAVIRSIDNPVDALLVAYLSDDIIKTINSWACYSHQKE